MRLNVLLLPVIIFSTFGFFVSAVDRATDHATKPLTKEALVKELSPITTANHKNYNQ